MEEQTSHKLQLSDRKTLTMTGVSEVLSFDEATIVLKTGLGTLVVQGRELRLKTLSPEGGQVTVNGTVSALQYEEPKEPFSWRSLFR